MRSMCGNTLGRQAKGPVEMYFFICSVSGLRSHTVFTISYYFQDLVRNMCGNTLGRQGIVAIEK